MILGPTLLCISVIACANGEAAEPKELEDALFRLEHFDRNATSEDSARCFEVIEAQGAIDDPKLVARLHTMMTNEELPYSVRVMALRTACEKAGDAGARAIIETLHAWSREMFPKPPPLSAAEVSAKDLLIQAALLQRLDHLQGALSTQEPLIDWLSFVALRGPGTLRPAAWKGLADNPGPVELRRKTALQVVAESSDWTMCFESLLRILGSQSIPALRKIFREASASGEFHHHAGSALAHFGDEDILPDLEAWLPKLAQQHRYAAGYAEGCIWKIKAQHPPSGLLDYVAADRPNNVESDRSRWAMQRALELGIPRERVREALLAHARRLEASGRVEDRNNLIFVKFEGLQVGVLEADDLPDIKIPEGLLKP